MDPAEPKIIVAIATYNEKENLGLLIQEIHRNAPQVDVLVVDDNSPDGTGELADQFAQADPRIHVLHRAGKLGLGTAILAGMSYSLEKNYDILVTMDADFSHHPRDLPAVLAGMKDKDIMIGSRYIPGGGTLNWPLSRKIMSGGVNFLVRILMRIPARDTSGGFRAYRTDLLRRTDFTTMLSKGYSFQQETLLRCHLNGARIGETPIIFENRTKGSTKVNYREIVRSLGTVIYLGLRTTLGMMPRGKPPANKPE